LGIIGAEWATVERGVVNAPALSGGWIETRETNGQREYRFVPEKS
jgi:hypothetical protein